MHIKQLEPKRNILFYALTICLVFVIVYFPILVNQQMYMYIDIGADTYCSYWPSLSYVQSWLSHATTWDMSLGLGAPAITQLCYFLIDPFNWVILLFRPSLMYIGIFISLMLKYIVLAIVSYLYIQKMKISNDYIICTIAASCIVFSGWFVGWGQHYNYATMYVFFIAVLFMFERWIQEKKWLGFVIVMAYLCMMTPYYSYMTLLFLAAYYLFRYFCINKKPAIKAFWLDGLKTAGLCLLAIGCSGILFLPAVEEILNSPRVGGKYKLGLGRSSVKELMTFILRLFSNNILGINERFMGIGNYYEAPFMYVGILGILVIPVLFCKQNRKRVNCVVGVLCLISIFLSSNTSLIFNAFSAITYRWTFLYVPVTALGIGKSLDGLKNKDSTNSRTISYTFLSSFLIIILYAFYLFRTGAFPSKDIFYTVILAMLVLVVNYVLLTSDMKGKYLAIYIVCIAELSLNSFWSVNCRSLISSSGIENMNYFDEANEAVAYLGETDTGFYRISKKYAYNDLNDNMIQHYSGEKYYCSTLSPAYWNMQSVFDLRGKNSNYLRGFDDKQFLRDITCGKYMISPVNKDYYGYELIESFGDKHLYINNNVLDFGILYDCYIDATHFNALPDYEKGDVAYQACILEDDDFAERFSVLEEDRLFEIQEIDCALSVFEDYFELILAQPNKRPLLVEITTSNFAGTMNGIIYNSIDINQTDISDYLNIEMEGDSTKYYLVDALHVNKLIIEAPPENIVGIHIYEKNMEPIEKQIELLKKTSIHIIELRDSYIHGTTCTDKEKLLFVPIIYDKNWHVYINGTEQNVLIANAGFMAVIVPGGESDIKIRYEAKSYRYGAILTLCSILVIVVLCAKDIRNYRLKKSSL